MAFWSTPASVEPKRQYRWILITDNIPRWIIKSVTKPVATTSDTAHKYFGYTYYYPGTTTWNTIDITLVDPVSPDAVNTIATMLRQSGYKPPRSQNDLVAISKDKANQAFGRIAIEQRDAEGNFTERWVLNNPFITTADFGGTLSYEQDGLIDLKITLRYDWAELETSNNGNVTKTVSGRGGVAVPGNRLTVWTGNDP